MKAADCVLGKAGGLTVSESLACGQPFISINVIPGQETGNVEYITQGKAGDFANDPLEVLETMYPLVGSGGGELYEIRSKNARRLGRPQAADDIAGLAWAAAMAPIDISLGDTLPQPIELP